MLAAQSAMEQPLSDGELTPEEAADVSAVLKRHRRLAESVKLEDRRDALATVVD